MGLGPGISFLAGQKGLGANARMGKRAYKGNYIVKGNPIVFKDPSANKLFVDTSDAEYAADVQENL